MTETQRNLFDEPHVRIAGNEVLEKAANRLLLIHDSHPEYFEGSSMGEITRRLYAEMLWEDGIHWLIPSDKKEEFINVVAKSQESDVYTRALRYLTNEKDLIRLPSRVVQGAERMRARIASSMR